LVLRDLTINACSPDKDKGDSTWQVRMSIEAGKVYLKLDSKIDL